MSSELSNVGKFQEAVHDADASRYFTLIGVSLLIYDHCLTLPDEVSLIWSAPRSFAKYAFLVNRYLVAICLLIVTDEICGLVAYSDIVCQGILSSVSILSIYSIGMGNILMLFRVALLWEKDRTILRFLIGSFIVSFIATFSTMVVVITTLAPGIKWLPSAKMCVTTSTSPVLIAVWASPMAFEVVVLILTTYNAFSRPRSAGVQLTEILHRDGALFFLALTVLRILNIVFAATANPGTTMFAVFFVWSMVTLTLNRLLLHIRAAEVAEISQSDMSDPVIAGPATSGMPFVLSGRASPFSFGVVERQEVLDNYG